MDVLPFFCHPACVELSVALCALLVVVAERDNLPKRFVAFDFSLNPWRRTPPKVLCHGARNQDCPRGRPLGLRSDTRKLARVSVNAICHGRAAGGVTVGNVDILRMSGQNRRCLMRKRPELSR